MPKTIAEKIICSHSRQEAKPLDIVLCQIDFCFGQDGTSSLIIDRIEELGVEGLKIKDACLVIDHNAPSPRRAISAIHQRMRKFCEKFGITLYREGEGICHQVILESARLKPGNLVLGADSHTCTYGALNLFSSGVGSTDAAITMATGKNWLRTPHTWRINLKGEPPVGISGKDIALHILSLFGQDEATYKVLEIGGPSLEKIPMDWRFTISNMSVECGATSAIFEPDKILKDWLRNNGAEFKERDFVYPDSGCFYERTLEINLEELVPLVAYPHSPANVHTLREAEREKIRVNMGFIGTCTNGRLKDLKDASRVLKGKKLPQDVRLIIGPASRKVFLEALNEGLIDIFLKSGAIVIPPGCGPCVGTHQGIPADAEVVMSTANRNFKGRMGNPQALIYLASASAVAASCLEGRIVDPRPYL